MGKALLVVIAVVLIVYAFFDLLATPKERVKYLPKWLWFPLLLLVPFGPLAWILAGQSKPSNPPPPQTRGWRPPSPRGPDDDPDYLRGL